MFTTLAVAQHPTLSWIQCRTLAESYLNEALDITQKLTVEELLQRKVVMEQCSSIVETARNDKDLLLYGRRDLNTTN
jgi:hypothetical protein